MELSQLSARLVDLLGLEHPPVTLAFTDKPPAEIAAATKAMPSACSFWREAEHGVFFASAEQHFNCPVGAMVMGFGLPAEVSEQLGGLVKSMCGQQYLSPDEPAKIPAVPRQSAGIIYGPLAEFPVEPDVILVWLTPQQGMIFTEAAGGANWADTLMQVSGRPGCAALPLALDRGQAGLSLGCAGMRTFTGIGDDRLLGVIPGGQAEDFAVALESTITANQAMGAYYREQAARFG
jgi:uncharacterized protein (DUF169 family)